MSAGDEITPQELAKAFRRLSDWAHGEEQGERSPFKSMLAEHFGRDPATFPVTREEVATYDLPNLQLALDAYLDAAGRTHTLVGFGGPVHHMEMSLSALVHDYGFGVVEGPVRRTVVPLERGRSLTCITIGLFVISDGETRLAVLVAQGDRHMGTPELQMEVIAPEQEDAERFLAEIRALMLEHNVYRAKVLALKAAPEMMGSGMAVEFPDLEPVSRDQIVLPEGVLDVGSSTPSSLPGMRPRCGRAVATCVADCFCTARRGRARR